MFCILFLNLLTQSYIIASWLWRLYIIYYVCYDLLFIATSMFWINVKIQHVKSRKTHLIKMGKQWIQITQFGKFYSFSDSIQ